MVPSIGRLAFILLLVVPIQGFGAIIDRAWCRYESPRFNLITDLAEPKARTLITKMERFRVAVELFIPTKTPDQPLKSFVFERRKDFVKVFNTRDYAGFMRPSLRENSLILGPGRAGTKLYENAFHEFVHHLLRNGDLASYPLWYEEGIASFLSGMTFLDDELRLGDAVKHRVSPHPRGKDLDGVRVAEIHSVSHIPDKEIPIAQLFQLTNMKQWPRDSLTSFYDRSMLVVHLFQLGHMVGFDDRRAALQSYLKLVNQGFATDVALETTFGLTYGDLEKQLRRYSTINRLPTFTWDYTEAPAYEIKSKGCLSRNDIAFELGIVSADWNVGYAAKLFDTMIRANSKDPRAYIGQSIISHRKGAINAAQTNAQRAVELDASHVWAKVQLANTLLETCMNSDNAQCVPDWQLIIRLYRAALHEEPERVDAIFGLGIVYLFTNRPTEAMDLFQQAYQHAPWAPRINLFLGETYRLTGDETNARLYLTRAYQWETKETWRSKAQEAMALLQPENGS